MKLWERFTSLAKGKPPSAEQLRQVRDDFITDRNCLAKALQDGNEQKGKILQAAGPGALKAHSDKLRDIADEIEARNIAIAELDRQIPGAVEADFENSMNTIRSTMQQGE